MSATVRSGSFVLACTMIAATWPVVSSLVICLAFTAMLPVISTCWS